MRPAGSRSDGCAAVYVGPREARAVVNVQPKAAFAPLLTESQVFTAPAPQQLSFTLVTQAPRPFTTVPK